MFVYEFLFRGRAPSDAAPSAWHVQLGDVVTSFGTSKTVVSDVMTPAAAKAFGFDLTTIIADINMQTLADLKTVKDALKDATTEIDATKTSLAAVTAERDAAHAELAALKEDAPDV